MPEIRQFDNRGKICRLPQAQGPGGGGRGGVRISLRPHKRREARRRWLSSGPIPILLPVTDLHQSVAHFPAGQGETAQLPAAFAAEDQAGVIVQLHRVQGTVLGITGGKSCRTSSTRSASRMEAYRPVREPKYAAKEWA